MHDDADYLRLAKALCVANDTYYEVEWAEDEDAIRSARDFAYQLREQGFSIMEAW